MKSQVVISKKLEKKMIMQVAQKVLQIQLPYKIYNMKKYSI